MDYFVDPKHPKKKAAICLKVILLITFAIGIPVIAISIYYTVNLKKIGGFVIVVAIIGAAIIGFSIIGLCGSGYDSDAEYNPNDKEDVEKKKSNEIKKKCLRIFWLAILIIVIVLWLVGLVCIISKTTIEYYIVMNSESFQEVIDELPESAGKTYSERVQHLASNMIIVGIMAMIVGTFLICPWMLASHVMGLRTFWTTFGIYGSIVMSLLGIGVIAIVAYFYAYVAIARSFSVLFIGVIALGAVLVLLGILGVVGYAVEEKYKWPIRLFAVSLILILLAFLVIAIIAVVQSTSLRSVVDKGISTYCELEEEDGKVKKIEDSPCYSIVQGMINFLCNDSLEGNLDPCPKTFGDNCSCAETMFSVGELTKTQFYDATTEFTVLLLKGNYIVVGVVGFLVVAYLIMMVGTVLYACCVSKKEENVSGDVQY